MNNAGQYLNFDSNNLLQGKRRILDPAVEALLDQVLFDRDRCLLAGISGVPVLALEAIYEGNEPTVQEAIALLSAARFFPELDGCMASEEEGEAELVQSAVEYEAALAEWYDWVHKDLSLQLNIIDPLLEQTGMDDVEAFLREYHIFMDDSALMAPGMGAFLEKLMMVLYNMENPPSITVPSVVVQTINENAATEEATVYAQVATALQHLNSLYDAGALMVRGDAGDTTVLSTFVSAFSKYKPRYNLVLFTQNPTLADAVKFLNSCGIEGADILLAKLENNGLVSIWGQEKEEQSAECDEQEELVTVNLQRMEPEAEEEPGEEPEEESEEELPDGLPCIQAHPEEESCVAVTEGVSIECQPCEGAPDLSEASNFGFRLSDVNWMTWDFPGG